MEKIFMDYLGPLPRTQRGYQYIFVAIDAFSRFCWLVPSRNVTAETTIGHLQNIFSLFGPSRSLVCDNAPAFHSGQFKAFCFGHGVKLVHTTPYYPQGSFAERINRNLKAALTIYHQGSPGRWDRSLTWINFAFNSAYHETLKATPASLMFAFPVNSPLSNLWNIHDLLPVSVTPQLIRENWRRAQANINRAHRRSANRYNRGRRVFRGKPGDWVYVYNYQGQARKVGKTSKFTPRFRGPYTIVEILGPGNLLVRENSTGRLQKVHLNQVKFPGSGHP